MMRIRPMCLEDCQAVWEIDQSCFAPSDRWKLQTFENLFQYPTYYYCVAEQEEQKGKKAVICGVAGMNVVGDSADIMTVAVKDAYRNEGLGGRLLYCLLSQAKASGCKLVMLEVRESNLAARNLYQAYKFEEIAQRRNYYQQPEETAIIMQRKLEEGDIN